MVVAIVAFDIEIEPREITTNSPKGKQLLGNI